MIFISGLRKLNGQQGVKGLVTTIRLLIITVQKAGYTSGQGKFYQVLLADVI
jgi:hypothetical protein